MPFNSQSTDFVSASQPQTLTGKITLAQNLTLPGGGPVNSTDAATKGYVDGAVSSGSVWISTVNNNTTTDPTPTETGGIVFDGTIPTALLVKVSVIAVQTAGSGGTVGDGAVIVKICRVRGDGTNVTINEPQDDYVSRDNDWDVTLGISGTNPSTFTVTVTGEANKTIDWQTIIEHKVVT